LFFVTAASRSTTAACAAAPTLASASSSIHLFACLMSPLPPGSFPHFSWQICPSLSLSCPSSSFPLKFCPCRRFRRDLALFQTSSSLLESEFSALGFSVSFWLVFPLSHTSLLTRTPSYALTLIASVRNGSSPDVTVRFSSPQIRCAALLIVAVSHSIC
jgi:hypothetical protein